MKNIYQSPKTSVVAIMGNSLLVSLSGTTQASESATALSRGDGERSSSSWDDEE